MRAIVILLALAAMGFAAPIPRTQRPARPMVGIWMDGVWGGARHEAFTAKRWQVLLAADGTYTAQWNRTGWTGSWSWDEKSRTLRISERRAGSGVFMVWEIHLDENLVGKTSTGIAIDLSHAADDRRSRK